MILVNIDLFCLDFSFGFALSRGASTSLSSVDEGSGEILRPTAIESSLGNSFTNIVRERKGF